MTARIVSGSHRLALAAGLLGGGGKKAPDADRGGDCHGTTTTPELTSVFYVQYLSLVGLCVAWATISHMWPWRTLATVCLRLGRALGLCVRALGHSALPFSCLIW